MNSSQKKSHLVVLSSPSGGGKTTICKALVQKYPQYKISISATTRPPRETEIEGTDYFFISRQEFLKKIDQQDFIEYEKVHGNYYGTLKSEVDKLLESGFSVIFDIDVYGALSIKEQFTDAILIFIRPPSLEELKIRLKNRKTDSEQEIKKRLDRLPREYEMSKHFDYDIINDNLDCTIKKIHQILNNE